MKLKSIPLVSTLVVMIAVAIMIALGFWQLGRAEEKEALLASYQSVPADAAPVEYPHDSAGIEANLYRPTRANCIEVLATRDGAGTNAVGAKGWAHIAKCKFQGEAEGEVALGWSREPNGPKWAGGEVSGIIGPGGKIVANPPLANLGPLAKPDPADLPNNHLSYAVQWFLFAFVALVIYFLALRMKLRMVNTDELDVKEIFGE